MSFPEQGQSEDELFAEMDSLQEVDTDWRNGRTFSLVYHPGEEIEEIRDEAYKKFSSLNALNPVAFTSILQFEKEVVDMTADLLQGDDSVVGNMTSGGTESIMMSVYAAREWARQSKGIDEPHIIVPETAHPAWSKAAHFVDIEARHVSARDDWRADPNEIDDAITDETALLVASAPSYPHGVVDPIEQIGQTALENDVLFHVDACIGGFMLPFVRDLGYEVPEFDFAVDGVTSISADPHKYGYGSKGSSVILYRNSEIRKNQYYSFDKWSGGIYASPNMQGTRPGGVMAGTWTVMKHLGREGYKSMANEVMDTVEKLQSEIRSMPEIEIISDPDMSIFAVQSVDDDVDIWVVDQILADQGWAIERQQDPPSIHLSVIHQHVKMIDEFINDFKDAVEEAKTTEMDEKPAPMYGLSAFLEDDDQVTDVVLDLLNGLFDRPD